MLDCNTLRMKGPVQLTLTCCPGSELQELMHLQGKIDHHRRNYAALIEGIMQRPRLLEHPSFSLRLVGSAANGEVELGLAGKIWAVTDRSSFKVRSPATVQAPMAISRCMAQGQKAWQRPDVIAEGH